MLCLIETQKPHKNYLCGFLSIINISILFIRHGLITLNKITFLLLYISKAAISSRLK